ncbi:MAG: LacI family DNA-binding transcriptional regulator [Solirubrobacteraceae bacterium]
MVERAPRQVTLYDVAREAGVHFTTVSRTLNASADLNIRPQTRERILAAAERLKYRPNALGRGLRLSSTHTLGLLVPSLRNPVYAAVVRGAFSRAWERGYVVVLSEDSEGGRATPAYERLVSEGRIDGLLVATARRGDPAAEQWSRAPVPAVFVNRRHRGGHNVSMREEEAARLAADHLLARGHTRLAHIAGPENLDTAARRVHGFRAAVHNGGHRAPIVPVPFDEPGGYRAMAELLRRKRPPTGVFVSNINQALGALAAAKRLGVAVPDQMSLITYDDDALAEYLDPPLTAVRMPMDELGATAVDVLLDRISGDDTRADVVLDTAPLLVERSSTAAIS